MSNLGKFTAGFIVILSLLIMTHSANATSGSCTASITPTTTASFDEKTYTVTVQNTGGATYNYIKIVPTSRFSTISASATNWLSATTRTQVVLSGSILSPSASVGASVVSRALNGETSSGETWTVLVSEDAGSSTITCTGTINVAITAGGTDSYEPIVSNIAVSDVTDSSAKITWETDELVYPTVNYGTTDSYGLTKSNTSLSSTQNITIDSLSSNITYYFAVTSTDTAGNSIEYSGYNFVTSKQQQTVTQTLTKTETKTETKVETKIIKDVIKPSLKIISDLSTVYKVAPEIIGIASDNSGVSSVYYSIDDGRNYLPVELKGKVGAKVSNFSFTPEIIDDGNYKIKLKVTDSSGNELISTTYNLIIDRLPPIVGGAIFSLGPMILYPDEFGDIYTIQGIDTKMVLSSVGGAISLEVLNALKAQSLVKNVENGLWSGILNFTKSGISNLQIKGIDGADNQTLTNSSSIVVLNPGDVSYANKFITEANITTYVFNNEAKEYRVWNSQPYGQSNPQMTDQEGKYKLILPSGKYYIEIKKSGYRPLRTQIFEISKPTPITTHFNLHKSRFPWDFFSTQAEVETNFNQSKSKNNDLVGKYFPDFILQDVDNISLLGKSGVITILSSWLPNFSEQISEVEKLSKEFPNINMLVILEQESNSKANIIKRFGNYDINIASDPDSKLFSLLNLNSLPTHIYFDRKGLVKKVSIGFLDSNMMVKNLLD